MIYQAKPQRGGRSIPTNTNNPPQDPPSPPEIIKTVPPTVTTPTIPPKMVNVPVPLNILQKIKLFFKKLFRRI